MYLSSSKFEPLDPSFRKLLFSHSVHLLEFALGTKSGGSIFVKIMSASWDLQNIPCLWPLVREMLKRDEAIYLMIIFHKVIIKYVVNPQNALYIFLGNSTIVNSFRRSHLEGLFLAIKSSKTIRDKSFLTNYYFRDSFAQSLVIWPITSPILIRSRSKYFYNEFVEKTLRNHHIGLTSKFWINCSHVFLDTVINKY